MKSSTAAVVAVARSVRTPKREKHPLYKALCKGLADANKFGLTLSFTFDSMDRGEFRPREDVIIGGVIRDDWGYGVMQIRPGMKIENVLSDYNKIARKRKALYGEDEIKRNDLALEKRRESAEAEVRRIEKELSASREPSQEMKDFLKAAKERLDSANRAAVEHRLRGDPYKNFFRFQEDLWHNPTREYVKLDEILPGTKIERFGHEWVYMGKERYKNRTYYILRDDKGWEDGMSRFFAISKFGDQSTTEYGLHTSPITAIQEAAGEYWPENIVPKPDDQAKEMTHAIKNQIRDFYGRNRIERTAARAAAERQKERYRHEIEDMDRICLPDINVPWEARLKLTQDMLCEQEKYLKKFWDECTRKDMRWGDAGSFYKFNEKTIAVFFTGRSETPSACKGPLYRNHYKEARKYFDMVNRALVKQRLEKKKSGV